MRAWCSAGAWPSYGTQERSHNLHHGQLLRTRHRRRAPSRGTLAFALAASAHIDVGDLDRVVSVAEPVPGWNIGLHVACCVGRAGAQGVPAGCTCLPIERPVLPLVGALRGLELRRLPFASA